MPKHPLPLRKSESLSNPKFILQARQPTGRPPGSGGLVGLPPSTHFSIPSKTRKLHIKDLIIMVTDSKSTQWTDLFSKEPARLSALPLTGPLPHTPHLVQPDSARPGNLIGVFGGIHNSTGQSFHTQSIIEVAYQQGALEPQTIFDDEMSVSNAAAFREITAVPFAGLNHHRIVHQARMVEKWTPYTIHLVQFADALLYVHPHWIQGIWGWRESHSELCPLVILMERAKSREEGERCIEKAMRYIELFHSLLPQYERASVHMNIERPRPEDFFCHDAEHDSVAL